VQNSNECLCLNCGLTYCLPTAELVLELQDNCDYPLVTNIFCTQCSGVLGVIDGDAEDDSGEVDISEL